MSETIRITVLVENSVHRQGLVAEHGLSFHVQCGERSLLFDTGQTDLAVINAETLRLPLDRVEAIVLSHGHYDHTGGVPAMLDVVPTARIYLHPAAFENKFSRNHAGVSAAQQQNDAAAKVNHQRLIIHERVGTGAGGIEKESAASIFVSGRARDFSRGKNAIHDLGAPLCFNESARTMANGWPES